MSTGLFGFGGIIGSIFTSCGLDGSGSPARPQTYVREQGAARAHTPDWTSSPAGQKQASAPAGARKSSVDSPEETRAASAIRMASRLVTKLEKHEGGDAFIALYNLSPEDRVLVAEKMLWLNRQHRSIIESLPRFNCSFVCRGDGRKDLACIEISCTSPQGKETSNTFSFPSRKWSRAADV